MRGRFAFLCAALVVAVAPFAAGAPAKAATVPILDTLGVASPTTMFSVFGAGGQQISPEQFAGPQFTITQPTLITEIGGFVNNCQAISMNVPHCPNTRPFTVQIRPSIGGVPDTDEIIDSFVLSHDDNPLVVSYETTTPNIVLMPGTYFALFAPQGADAGFLLSSAQDPFSYMAGVATIGFVRPESAFSGSGFAAVRILGILLPTEKAQCKDDRWLSFGIFKNQGNCVRYVITGKLHG